MIHHRDRITMIPALLATLIVAGGTARAAGFGIVEQGAKAMGLANAFAAQADDPSANYFNVGGLAFQHERGFAVGTTLIGIGDSTFTGALPFPGPTTREEQVTQIVTPSHLYWVEPLGESLVFGLGVNNPFGLITEWDDPDNFTGRFISTKADLKVYDLNANLAWRVNDRFGVGVGLIARGSTVELERRAPQLNPFTNQVVEVAAVRLKSDFDTGYGFNLGFLHKPTDRFSWGFNYRGSIEVDYGGDGRLTQTLTGDPMFDALIATALPFDADLPIETSIEFPDTASLAFAYRFTDTILVEADINRVGWSSFDTTDITFVTEPLLNTTIDSNWDDSNNYRFGLLWDCDGPGDWRFGAYFDESPQPDTSVGPLLPDADRIGVSVGHGRPLGTKLHGDFSVMYIKFDERTTLVNDDGYDGTYDTRVWLLGATLGW